MGELLTLEQVGSLSDRPSQTKSVGLDDKTKTRLLQLFIAEYRRTGQCDYHVLVDVAKRAKRGQFLLPKQAQALSLQLETIMDKVRSLIPKIEISLRAIVAHVQLTPSNSDISIDVQTLLLDHLEELARAVDQLLSIAQKHPEPAAETSKLEDTKTRTCYESFNKRINDLRYALRYLNEHLRSHLLVTDLRDEQYQGIYLRPIRDCLQDIQTNSTDLSERVQIIIADKVAGTQFLFLNS
jgi:hypothetical protein